MNTVSVKLFNFAKQEFKLTDDKAKEFIDLLGEMLDDIKYNGVEYKSAIKQDLSALELNLSEKLSVTRVDMEKGFKEQTKLINENNRTVSYLILGVYAGLLTIAITLFSRLPASSANAQNLPQVIHRIDTVYLSPKK